MYRKKYEKRTSNQQSLSELIDFIFKQAGKEELMLEVKAEIAWRKLMGTFLEQWTDKMEVKKGVIYLKINSPAMRNEIIYAKSKIIENINEELDKDYIYDLKIY
ncbi:MULTISPECIES: DciA family protein [Weeksella]|uniref:DUF721 domain-containing protein n=1 Tax=Weeksella virosa (strain ATCC 43766 / DSM 16922 / JCM 21250 / CCUG 30538 / CDC 9751 / IAM 14551 / NBRC 16016 / NCTC 11634 / CL345/78) TaxID=865938 RepID=F0P273_WEEVC|nr:MULTISPECIES: DciA family protein [Weeksella]ADX67763.1 protein of unknown function DUF721 [Weeksella virosa DSM 16922]MDK7374054.1 DciA family protein [Weeksella virosa]MDK7674309.1 DciA family protein [Weeksella virosa]OFM82740.1 histidine kinase [Weeksella sp. HMSC059D05]SUP54062.1 Zn-ribbon-containing, possibly RNA-binding protein and truncated derivatives [Weeksella virosa]